MLKIIVLGITVFAFTACSSKQDIDYTKSQYCYTDQIIKNTAGVVSSETVLVCTDRPSRQAEIQRAGIDKNCKEFWYDEVRNGRVIRARGVRCEKFNGTWEIINTYGNVR